MFNWQRGTTSAETYEEWKAEALSYDEGHGGARWRSTERSSDYDYKVIRRRLNELRDVRASGDTHRLVFYLSEGIHGNMGGMGEAVLYRRARFGTKDLITEFSTELAEALRQIASAREREISLPEKLAFFRNASLCFGRSALMLSGGGSLGPFHVGVVNALVEQRLLPDVISGSSAGSLIAAILATHTDKELRVTFDARTLFTEFSEFAQGTLSLEMGTRQLSTEEVRNFIASKIPDMTFYEAFERTGRKVNITVSPSEVHQSSRLLNAVTSPNVCIREAVLSSCAIPGIFPPVTLMAKDVRGNRVPYVPSRTWVDGSLSDDLPAKRLTRLYGVNHFITSQVNPMVRWALQEPGDDIFGRLWDIQQTAVREWYRATFPLAMEISKNFYPLNVYTRMFYSVAMQDYTADITIMPTQRFVDPAKLLSALTEDEASELILDGQRCTWPKIEMVRNCTRVGRTIDEVLVQLEKTFARRFAEPEQAAAAR